jgi:hypothetical protein
MSIRNALSVLSLVCLALTPTLGAQKGGKPKAVAQRGVATFRCVGPTSLNHTNPDGTGCTGPNETVPDGFAGDTSGAYYGVGEYVDGSGAFLRTDGEFEVIVRPTDGRQIFLNFDKWLTLPSSGNPFVFADVTDFRLNTNVVLPGTDEVAPNGILSVPENETWNTRIKSGWVDTYGKFYSIRFNPTAYAPSTYASVTRIDANTWKIFATETQVAKMTSAQTSKGKPTGPVDEGTYQMPFEITFTCCLP